MRYATAAAALCATAFCSAASAGPAKGNVECEGTRHAIKSAVAIWVPEKKQFQVMFYTEALSDADQALAARLEGESVLGKIPQGMQPQTVEEQKKRREFSNVRAMLVRGYLKEVADKIEEKNITGAVLFSANCGKNSSFNMSMRYGEKEAYADLKKQLPGLVFPLKQGATVKLTTGKFERKPDAAKKSGSQMSAAWQFQGESKLVVIE